MDLLLIALLLLAVGGVVVVALGRVGGGLAAAPADVVPPLEEQVSRASDLDRARFSLALRGYRMDQVDTVLDETRDLLAAKDEEIARLRRRLAPSVDLSVDRADPEPEPEPEPDAATGSAVDPEVEPDVDPEVAPARDGVADPARSGHSS